LCKKCSSKNDIMLGWVASLNPTYGICGNETTNNGLRMREQCDTDGAVTISGKSDKDSKQYQEKQVRQAIEEVKK